MRLASIRIPAHTVQKMVVCTGILASFALASCGKGPNVPSPFEVIGQSDTSLGRAVVLRDRGTGCEMVAIAGVGIMPRNERSVDGASVKQRCVITGDETPTQAGNGTPIQPSSGTQPAFQPAPNPVGPDAQEQAVRDAIRAQTQGAIPPAGPEPEAAPSIPPPKGGTKGTPVPAPEDGVESQLKN